MSFDSILQAAVALIVGYLLYRRGSDRMTLVQILKTTEDTHTLVNEAHGLALSLGAESARYRAEKEPTPENERAALLAEKLHKEHAIRQETLDRKEDWKGVRAQNEIDG